VGYHDRTGNAGEWLADGAGQGRYYAAGLSWRDTASTAAGRTSPESGDKGYDDIGFRLVRDVGADELSKP